MLASPFGIEGGNGGRGIPPLDVLGNVDGKSKLRGVFILGEVRGRGGEACACRGGGGGGGGGVVGGGGDGVV